MSAIEPFLDKLRAEEKDEKEKEKEALSQSRKHTLKQTLRKSKMGRGSDDSDAEDAFDAKYLAVGKRDVVFKKGFLSKQGKKFKHFHERYFILWSNGLMNYYSKEHTVFANYTEQSKSQSKLLSPSPNSNQQNEKFSAMDENSGDENPIQNLSTPKVSSPSTPITPRTKKRRSTLRKLGLKSDVIKPKGTIDVNDLIETQFLEFADDSPGWALITAEREWKFKCASDRERREWIAAVHAVNYGISPFDFDANYTKDIKYENGAMLLSPAQNAFIRQSASDSAKSDAVAAGWMFKLGAAVRGLEQNYWKKRWVSLYKKPARLAYAAHPYAKEKEGNEENVSSPKSVEVDEEDEEKMKSVPTATLKRGNSNSKGKMKEKSLVKGVIVLSDVKNILRIGNNALIKEKYRAPTVHVFALITDKRTWVFSCKTSEECAMWYDRISFFLPNQWKAQSESEKVDVEELLRFNRIKTMADGGGGGDDTLKVSGGDEDTVMSKILRKVSNAGERLGIIEQYSTISGVQPKGTITDYDDGVNAIGSEENEQANE